VTLPKDFPLDIDDSMQVFLEVKPDKNFENETIKIYFTPT
jgi:hypothetical protein